MIHYWIRLRGMQIVVIELDEVGSFEYVFLEGSERWKRESGEIYEP